MLRSAIRDLITEARVKHGGERRDADNNPYDPDAGEIAERWIAGESCQYPFAWACDALNIDPDGTRLAIRRLDLLGLRHQGRIERVQDWNSILDAVSDAKARSETAGLSRSRAA